MACPIAQNGHKKREMHNVEHASSHTYLYKWIHPRRVFHAVRILADRYSCRLWSCHSRYLHHHKYHGEFDDTGRQKITTPSLSIPAQNLRLLQIFPVIDSLPASGLTTGTLLSNFISSLLWLDRFFWSSRFFVFSSWAGLRWLFVSFWSSWISSVVSYRVAA